MSSQPIPPPHTETPLSQQEITFIGIDGGGTSTKAICLNQSLHKIKSCHLELSCNPNSVGMDTAIERIALIVRSVKNDRVRAIGLGLAGNSSFHADKLKEAIWEAVGDRNVDIFIESDAYAALCSAYIAEGMVLIAGTGVNCSGYEFNEDGQRRLIRSAAWGPLLGDSGSGFWIGQQALTRLCEWTDRIIEKPHPDEAYEQLRDMIFEQLGCSTMEGMVKWVYQDPSWSRIASLTKVVVENAKNNAVCADIVNAAGAHLARYVKNVARQLRQPEDGAPFKVVLVGSVIAREDSPVRESLVRHLEGSNTTVVLPSHSAEEGAAWMGKFLQVRQQSS